MAPGNSGLPLSQRWETLIPASPARAVALRSGGSGGAGWAVAKHLEPPWSLPDPGALQSPPDPAARKDADPRRGVAGRALCPSPGRPAAVEQARAGAGAGTGGRSLLESRAKPELCAKLGAPAGLQRRCGSAQRGNRCRPGGAGFHTSAPGAGQLEQRDGRGLWVGDRRDPAMRPEPDLSTFARRGEGV